jgi:hypothetical protein
MGCLMSSIDFNAAKHKNAKPRNNSRKLLIKKLILGSSALISASIATNTYANSVTGAVVSVNASPYYITTTPLAGETAVINIDTEDMAGAAYAVYSAGSLGATTVNVASGRTADAITTGLYLNSFYAPIVVSNDGIVKGGAYGMYLDSYWGGVDGGDITVSGSGTIEGATAFYAHSDVGTINVDGLKFNATTLGIGTLSYGGVNLGMNTRLGAVKSGGAGIDVVQAYLPASNGDINIKASDITATAGIGLHTLAWEKDTNININGALKSGLTGIYSTSTAGNINITGSGTGTIDAGDEGITVATIGGNVRIADFASINAADTGIWAGGVYSSGNWVVENNGSISGNGGTGVGAWIGTTTGNISILNNGAITGKVTEGLTLGSNSGNVIVKNNASITGARDGIWSGLIGTGAWDISNNGNITGTSKTGIEVATVNNDITINNNGNITGGGVDGIWATSTNGNLTIKDNGIIKGADDGIEAYATGAGKIDIKTTKDVTGTADYGIYAVTVNGQNKIDIAGGNVVGGNVGLDAIATGSGNVLVDVAAGSTVRGTTYGAIIATISGTGTLNNRGLITDTNAASDTGGDALWMYSGTNTTNNYGTITGRVHASGIQSTFNNMSGAVWNAGNGENLFNTATDAVYNSGIINIRAGQTTFRSLEKFENRSGGLIDMTVGSAPTDDLLVYNFSPLAGSHIKINFDASAALGLGDAGETGTADTIRVAGLSTPSGQSFIDVIAKGGMNSAGEPKALTGSVAVVYTGITMAAPTAGAKLTSSSFYNFGTGNPSTNKRVFTLVDDTKGGVFMQWQPRINASTMGAFAGGDLSNPNGSSIGSAQAGMGGVATSGGITSVLADASAGGTGNQCFTAGNQVATWGNLSKSWSDYKTSGKSNGWSASAGWEHSIGQSAKSDCGRNALGWFAFVGADETEFATGASDTQNGGVGIYYRRGTSKGTYMNLLAAASDINSDIVNGVFETKASTRGTGLMGDVTIGKVKDLSTTTKVDLRASATWTNIDTHKFVDTDGFETDKIDTDLFTVAASVGLRKSFDDNGSSVYGRLGAKRTNIDTAVHTYGIKTAGSGKEDFGTADLGIVKKFTDKTNIGIGGFGEFSDATETYGVKIFGRHVW